MSRSLQRVSSNLHKDVDDDVSAILTQITYSCNAVSQSESLNDSVFEGNNDYQNGRIIITRSNQDATHTNTNRNVTPTRTVRDATSAHPVRNATSTRTSRDATSARNATSARTGRDATSTRTSRDATSARNATSTRTSRDATSTRTSRDATRARNATSTRTDRDATSARDAISTRTDRETTSKRTSRDATSTRTSRDTTSTLTDRDATSTRTSRDATSARNATSARTGRDATSTRTDRDATSAREVTNTRTVRDATSTRSSRDATSARNATSARTGRDATSTRTDRDATSARSNRHAACARTDRDAASTRSSRDAASARTSRDATSARSSRDAASARSNRDAACARTDRDAASARSNRDAASARTVRDATSTRSSRDVTSTRTSRDATIARTGTDATSIRTVQDATPTRTIRDTTSVRTVRDAKSARDATSTRTDIDTTSTRTVRDATSARDGTSTLTDRDATSARTSRDATSARDATSTRTSRDATSARDATITLTDSVATSARTSRDAFSTCAVRDATSVRSNRDADSARTDRDATNARTDKDTTSTRTDHYATNARTDRDATGTRPDRDAIRTHTDKDTTRTRTVRDANTVRDATPPLTDRDAISAPTNQNDFSTLTDQSAIHAHTYQDTSCTHSLTELGKEPESDSDHDDYDDDPIGDVFEEIRQKYGDELPDTLSAYRRNDAEEIDTEDIENHIDSIPIQRETQTEEPNTSCATCCKPRRVEHSSWLQKGQHIRLPGEHLKFTFKKKVIPVYRHHAIIKEVKSTAENSVKLDLIHFLKQDKKISIHRTTNTYNLEKDDIDIIDYERPRYDADTIVQRAESMLQEEGVSTERKEFKSYNVILRNCEHFASWCVVGESESFQAKDFKKTSFKVINKAAGIGCKIGRFVARFLYNASDEIAASFNVVKLPGVLLGVSAFIYLVYTICMTIYHRRKYSKRKMCKVCFKREVISLWISFGAFCVTSGISYILVHFLLPLLAPTPVGIPLLLIIVLICLFLQWGLGKVIKALMWPYACDKIEVKRLSQITPGSMITFKYFGKQHAAIVTEKHTDSDDLLTGNITFVHYGLKGISLFGTRHVKEDAFRLNVEDNEKDVKLVDCSALKTFSPDVVVARVKARIGETNWSLFKNRSVHLCFDCLVHEEYGQENLTTQEESVCQTHPKRKSTLYLGRKEIHLRSDLEAGHIVKYFGHTGIVVSLEDCTEENQQKFQMELIVYKSYCGTRRKFSVDLKKKRLYIEKYHPAHCYQMAERVRRACEKEGKYCEFWRKYSFLESCILKEE